MLLNFYTKEHTTKTKIDLKRLLYFSIHVPIHYYGHGRTWEIRGNFKAEL